MSGAFSLRCRIDFDPAPRIDRVRAGRDAALREAGEYLLRASREIAPLRTGAMVASARLEAGPGRVRVSYNTPYARRQHWAAEYRHPNGRRAYYLSSVAERPEVAQTLREAFAARLAEDF